MSAAAVSNWIVIPAPLSKKNSGNDAEFSANCSTVRRVDPERNKIGCVCYTSDPLPLGNLWQTTVLSTSSSWSGYGGFVSEWVV